MKLILKKDFDESKLGCAETALGYKSIELKFNLGPFSGGGDCIIIKADGELTCANSNDIIHDLEAYEITE